MAFKGRKDYIENSHTLGWDMEGNKGVLDHMFT